MRISLVLADTGRPNIGSGTLNLLNAGWTFTTGIPVEPAGFAIPSQVLAIFVEAPWDQLNRPWPMILELVDDEAGRAQLVTGAEGAPLVDARIEQEITVAPVPGAPNGTPGTATYLAEFPAGALRVPAARRRYIWRVTVGADLAEVGFWVGAPTQVLPKIGGPHDPPSPTGW